MRFDIPNKPWDDLSVYQIADSILCAPDSHPDAIIKRVGLLRDQGHNAYADLVEQQFDLSDEAKKRWEVQADAIAKWAESL